MWSEGSVIPNFIHRPLSARSLQGRRPLVLWRGTPPCRQDSRSAGRRDLRRSTGESPTMHAEFSALRSYGPFEAARESSRKRRSNGFQWMAWNLAAFHSDGVHEAPSSS